MRRTKNGYTRKQYAYAQNNLGGKGKTKKEIALMSGYAPSVAHSVVGQIESTEGYANAMHALAGETGNFALKVYHSLNKKDLDKEDFKTLLNSITTLAEAFERFTPKRQEQPAESPLRAILAQKVNKQTINVQAK